MRRGDRVVIEGDDCEELARFWSQALGCIITARARTSAALSRRREVPPWMSPATSCSSPPEDDQERMHFDL
jgi:hypothetical protein